MSFFKSFTAELNQEDILFAVAVAPAAFVWIFLESFPAGVIAGVLSYAAVVAGHEYCAQKYGWPSVTAANVARKLWLSYGPLLKRR